MPGFFIAVLIVMVVAFYLIMQRKDWYKDEIKEKVGITDKKVYRKS